MDVVTYALLNKKIKGLTSGIQGASISGTTITFTMADGTKEIMTFPTPADGVSITDVDVDTDKHLIVTLSDGNTVDAGEIPTVKGDKGDKGEKGDTGFSPTITENPDNTNEIYKLDVTNEDGTFTTPNLKGTGGGLDPDKYYDKAQIDTLVEPLAEAKHTHDNKDTVLDKLTTNDAGDTLLFNGNAINGSVEIDDTTTEATDKVWSAKKTNDTFDEVKQSVTDTNAKFADYDTSAEVDDKFTDFETILTNAIKTWVDSEESFALKTTLFKNNTLTFYKKPNATVDDTADFTINLPEEQFLDQTKTTFVNEFAWSEELYSNSTNPNLDTEPVLVLAVKGDTDVVYSFISMNKLVKIYKASTVASTVTLAIDDATNTISGEVNISADEGNLLEVGTDGGLYAKATDITGKADKLTDTDVNENQILLDDGNGNIKASGKDISEYIPAWSGTKAEWEALNKATLADGAIVHITDDFVENPVQVKAMPDTATEGDVVQYIGETNSDFTCGYWYKYTSDETGILSWKYLPVDAVYKPSNEEVLDKFSENDEGKVLYNEKELSGVEIDDTATDVTDKTWSAKKINESIPNSEDFVQNLKMWSAGDIETLALESVSGLVTISSAVTGMPIDSAAWIGSVNATSTHRQISVQPFGSPSLLYTKIYNASSQTWSAWTKIDAGSIEGKKTTDLLQNLGTLTSGSLLDYVLTLPASGFIYCNGNVTDTPADGTYFIVDVRKMGTTYGVTATKFNSGEMYTNRYNSTSKTWYGWKQMATINDKSTTSTTETYSVKKINDMLSTFPFKWKLIGTSTPETGATSSNTFNQTMSGGNPFCVYHSSGIFCFGNGIPANRGKLYGMTSGAVASVTYTAAGLLTVEVGSGTAYIYEMEGIG